MALYALIDVRGCYETTVASLAPRVASSVMSVAGIVALKVVHCVAEVGREKNDVILGVADFVAVFNSFFVAAMAASAAALARSCRFTSAARSSAFGSGATNL